MSAGVAGRSDAELLGTVHDQHGDALSRYEWRFARHRPDVIADQLPKQTNGDTPQQGIDRQLVIAALRTLSSEHRRVLVECYFRGASVAEAAETLHIPEGTIKSRTHYALRALRQAIDDLGGAA